MMTTQELRKNLKTATLDGCVQQAENVRDGTGGPSFVLSQMDGTWLHHFGVCVWREMCDWIQWIIFLPQEKQMLLGAM